MLEDVRLALGDKADVFFYGRPGGIDKNFLFDGWKLPSTEDNYDHSLASSSYFFTQPSAPHSRKMSIAFPETHLMERTGRFTRGLREGHPPREDEAALACLDISPLYPYRKHELCPYRHGCLR